MDKISSNKRYLIINADDFGMCHSVNQAIKKLLEDKVITSASIMPVCPWFEEAAMYARQLCEADIGIHLTFTSEWYYYKWGPISNGKSLTEERGYFPEDCYYFEENARNEEVITEIWAQINKVKAAGIRFSNIDNHMGSLYGLMTGRSFLPVVFEICRELGMPFRFPKSFSEHRRKSVPKLQLEEFEKLRDLALAKDILLIDYLVEYPYQLKSEENYKAYVDMIIALLRDLSPGISELYIHPSLDSKEIRAINPTWEKRVMEFRVFYEDRVQRVIEKEGIELISWGDLKLK